MDTRKAAAWFIIAIMVLSIGGFIGGSFFTPDSSASFSEEFNGFVFKRENNLWVTAINGQEYGLLYLPRELQSLSLPVSVTAWRGVEKVHLIDESADNASVAASSLALLQNVLYVNNVRLQEACRAEDACVKDVPIVNCQQPAIIIRDADSAVTETTLLGDYQCLIIRASSSFEFEKVSERIIYEFLGVLP